MKYKSPNGKEGFFLIFLVVISFLIRIRQVSFFNIYPDSYIYMLSSLSKSSSDKILYVYLLKLLNLFTSNPELSGHILSFFFSTASVLLVYFVCKKLAGTRLAIISSLIFCISFSSVYWAGLIGVESIAVFFALAALYFLDNPILCGFSIFISSLTRPEYILLFLPYSFLIDKLDLKKAIQFYLWIIIWVVTFILLPGLKDLIVVSSVKSGAITFFTDFLKMNPAAILSFIGLAILFKRNKKIFFSALSFFLVFSLIYIYINPLNWRYNSILILPSSFLSAYFIDYLWVRLKMNRFIINLCFSFSIVLLLLQILISWEGLPETKLRSYESTSAREISNILSQQKIKPQHGVGFYNYAYNFYLHIEFDQKLDVNRKLNTILILDEPLLKLQPELKELTKGFNKIGEFKNDNYYYIGNKRYKSDSPVEVFLFNSNL